MRKLLVANRGEIATRAFRAAYELGLRSVAIYTPEDRESVHRVKADEAYEIGEPGHPVRGYLDPELIAETATSVRRARSGTSPSSVRRPPSGSAWATRSGRAPQPGRPACRCCARPTCLT